MSTRQKTDIQRFLLGLLMDFALGLASNGARYSQVMMHEGQCHQIILCQAAVADVISISLIPQCSSDFVSPWAWHLMGTPRLEAS